MFLLCNQSAYQSYIILNSSELEILIPVFMKHLVSTSIPCLSTYFYFMKEYNIMQVQSLSDVRKYALKDNALSKGRHNIRVCVVFSPSELASHSIYLYVSLPY